MGWKAIRDHYRIGHIVQVVPDKGICIGSAYVHDIIVIRDGEIVRRWGSGEGEIGRYLEEMDADPAKLAELAACEDQFEHSITVYTYEGGAIVEKQCEELGWPNVTHDGLIQFENTFSADRAEVLAWAKRDAEAGIELGQDRVERAKADLVEACQYLARRTADLQKLTGEEQV